MKKVSLNLLRACVVMPTLASSVSAEPVSIKDFVHTSCSDSEYTQPVLILTPAGMPALSVMGGNLGVGTTAPSSKLNVVNGLLKVEGNGAGIHLRSDDGWTQFLATRGASGGQAAFISAPNVAFSSANPYWAAGLSGDGSAGWSLDTWDGTALINRIRVLPSSGNVGIGMANPTSTLDVTSTKPELGRFASSTAGMSYFELWNTQGTGSNFRMLSKNTTGNGHASVNMAKYAGNGAFVINNEETAPSAYIGLEIAGVSKLHVESGGNMGVGTVFPQYKLDVTGTIRGFGITDTSDVRLKRDVENMHGELDRLLRLRGVTYFWRDSSQDHERQIGLIAQEVEKVYPELVKTDAKGFKSVNYSHLVAPLVEGLREVTAQTQRTEAQLASLSAENAQLYVRAKKAESENAALKARIERIEMMLQTK